MPSDPLGYNELFGFTQPLRATFQATVSSPGERRSLLVEGNDDIALKRVIGCLMIVMMPKEGLKEALTSLKDMLEFYTEVPTLSLPSKPSTHQVTGTVASATRRPDLVVAE